MGYLISHSKLELEIKLEEIRKLHVHEEIIPEIVGWLSDEIKRGMYTHPVIVDKKTLVVLDGMHRVGALQHLGYKLIPACLVDYNNPSIKVESWFRIIENGQKTGENIRKDLEKSGYKLQEITFNDLKRKIDSREIIVGIMTSRKSYGIPGKIRGIRKIYAYIEQIGENLRSVGYNVGYGTESNTVNKVKSGKALATIIAPQITKRHVITTALSGKAFIYKATRHVIPARPLFVNVPVEWLNMDLKEANALLLEHLYKKKLRHLPPGQTFNQLYEEELYVFDDVISES